MRGEVGVISAFSKTGTGMATADFFQRLGAFCTAVEADSAEIKVMYYIFFEKRRTGLKVQVT